MIYWEQYLEINLVLKNHLVITLRYYLYTSEKANWWVYVDVLNLFLVKTKTLEFWSRKWRIFENIGILIFFNKFCCFESLMICISSALFLKSKLLGTLITKSRWNISYFNSQTQEKSLNIYEWE